MVRINTPLRILLCFVAGVAGVISAPFTHGADPPKSETTVRTYRMSISGARAFDPGESVYALGECTVTFGPNSPFLKSPFEIRCLSGVIDLESDRILLKHPATLMVDGKEISTLDPKGSILVEKGQYEIEGDTYSITTKRH